MVLCVFETTVVLFNNFHVLYGEGYVSCFDVYFDIGIKNFELPEQSQEFKRIVINEKFHI